MAIAIVGGNWGDEGKGKMVDLLAGRSDIVVRYQGGSNAGHTVINAYGKFVLHMLPSGVFHQGVVNLIAQGVALNVPQMFKEMDEISKRGVPPQEIRVSDRAQIVMPYHVLFDQLEENRLGEKSFGSTQSGIAPFYADKYLKTGIQICELFEDEALKEKVETACAEKNLLLESKYDTAPLEAGTIFDELCSYRARLKPMIIDAARFLDSAIKEKKKILLEGQLGALRDPDNGIYPYTTSSSPLAGFAAVGAGIPPYEIKEIITVVKAYSSCVGAGAFVTEIFGAEAETLRELGGDSGEYGATTGRPRRMGWFDIVASQYGCMLQGTTEITLSLLDVLGYLDQIPVCIAYEINGRITTDFPSTPELKKAKPVYAYLEGWRCDIREIRDFHELPENAKNFVRFIETHVGYPIRMISNGPKREDYIVRDAP